MTAKERETERLLALISEMEALITSLRCQRRELNDKIESTERSLRSLYKERDAQIDKEKTFRIC